jgi:RNA polymerase sigma factor (sigma-70 family)
MVSAVKRSTRRPGNSSRKLRDPAEQLRRRTRDLLDREIGFIPNPRFREFDAEGFWKECLDEAGQDADHPDTHADNNRLRMPAHLERMCHASLLSPQDERDLFCRMNYLKYRANAIRSTLNVARPSKRKIEEIEQLLAAATTLRNRIITANTRLVISIVKKFADEKNPFDDLLSEGVNCLVNAVEKFDFDRGFRFSTYATSAVRREVFRLIQRHHRDRTRFTTGTNEVLGQLLNTDGCEEMPEASWGKLDRSLRKMICQLDEREQFIVNVRYGFDKIGEKPTFHRLGQILGVSKERVRQLEQRALNKLRDMAVGERLDFALP